MLSARSHKLSTACGFTVLELIIGLGIMSIIVLAGTKMVQQSLHLQQDMLETMDAASTEVMVSDRLYQDLKFAAPSFNFLIRLDDGRTANGLCRAKISLAEEKLTAEEAAKQNKESYTSPCYNEAQVVAQGGSNNRMADYDFYLYDPSCLGGSHCYRSITLNANDTYPDHKSGKRDFFIIATDTSVKNGFGITGGIEFFNPADAFKFLDTSKLSLEEIPTNCPSGVRYCNSFQGLAYKEGKLSTFLASERIGRYLLLSSPIKNPTKLDNYDLGYPDLYIHYPLRILSRLVDGQKKIDVRPDFSLAKAEHLQNYQYASNYIIQDDKENNAAEIFFHDEEIFGGLSVSGPTQGRWAHYYHAHPHPGGFLKILQAYNGNQADYIVRPIRIIRYHLSDAYSRALASGVAHPDKSLRNQDPCLTRYIYQGSPVDGDGSGPRTGKADDRGHWHGTECQYPGVEQIVFFRPNVSLPLVSFKVRMQSEQDRKFYRKKTTTTKQVGQQP